MYAKLVTRDAHVCTRTVHRSSSSSSLLRRMFLHRFAVRREPSVPPARPRFSGGRDGAVGQERDPRAGEEARPGGQDQEEARQGADQGHGYGARRRLHGHTVLRG